MAQQHILHLLTFSKVVMDSRVQCTLTAGCNEFCTTGLNKPFAPLDFNTAPKTKAAAHFKFSYQDHQNSEWHTESGARSSTGTCIYNYESVILNLLACSSAIYTCTIRMYPMCMTSWLSSRNELKDTEHTSHIRRLGRERILYTKTRWAAAPLDYRCQDHPCGE